jgi:hypothetical protein
MVVQHSLQANTSKSDLEIRKLQDFVQNLILNDPNVSTYQYTNLSKK